MNFLYNQYCWIEPRNLISPGPESARPLTG